MLITKHIRVRRGHAIINLRYALMHRGRFDLGPCLMTIIGSALLVRWDVPGMDAWNTHHGGHRTHIRSRILHAGRCMHRRRHVRIQMYARPGLYKVIGRTALITHVYSIAH